LGLTALRAALAGQTQEQIAVKLGVAQQRISDWINSNTASGNTDKTDGRAKVTDEQLPHFHTVPSPGNILLWLYYP